MTVPEQRDEPARRQPSPLTPWQQGGPPNSILGHGRIVNSCPAGRQGRRTPAPHHPRASRLGIPGRWSSARNCRRPRQNGEAVWPRTAGAGGPAAAVPAHGPFTPARNATGERVSTTPVERRVPVRPGGVRCHREEPRWATHWMQQRPSSRSAGS
jgi:hypothetical protein